MFNNILGINNWVGGVVFFIYLTEWVGTIVLGMVLLAFLQFTKHLVS